MQLFERNVEVDRLASAVDPARADADALLHQATLAWYLRQRDNARANALAADTRQRLTAVTLPPDVARRLEARLALIEAETHWLRSELDDALRPAEAALATFSAVDDPIGCADAHGILAAIHSSAGNLPVRDESLAAAVHCARLGQDTQRVDYFEANQARYAALRDVRQSHTQWSERFPLALADVHPGVSASIHSFFATRDYNSGNLARALEQFDHAFAAATASGQVITAVVVAVNAGSVYVALNDHDAALEWLQRGLDLARPCGWAVALGPCLRQMGEIMRVMGRLDAAQSLLDEAMEVYAPLRQSRNFSSVLTALGDLAQTRGDYPRALALFREQVERAQHMAQADQAIEGRIGIANALLQLGDDGNAEHEVQIALQQAQNQGAAVLEVSALRLLARIHAHRGARGAALERLQQALEVAHQIDGLLIPGDLLFSLAEEYAQEGRHAEAYRMAVQASEARERVLNQEASNRATAMQVRLDTERSHAQTEHHRRQAEAEARRAALLQQTSDTLERLGTIGQEITSQLDKEHVFQAIERHVHGLLDASSFAIYLMDSDGRGLTSVYDIEEGERLPGDHVSLDDPQSFSARCIRERRELLIDFSSPGLTPNYVPGTLVTMSALFAPLAIADRVLGVMTIQSTRRNAYAENERLIFRTLCAYTAIALDNAVAYTHLRDAKDQLVVQEKLAALGALVAGVAHELNTPIGNSMLTASTLQENTSALEAAAAGGTMRRSTLSEYIASTQEGLELVIRGLRSAGELVQSFKQVAVDRATEQRRSFDLRRTSQEIVATLQRSIQVAGHRLVLDIPTGIVMDGYPGPYGQVLTNLINNALLHAFDGRKGGTMHLRAQPLRQTHVEIVFSDDGVGIASENLGRIFDPFFTTKLGQGGSGLGMSISYNIVTSLFGGELDVSSQPGQGTCFTIRLPLQAPHNATEPLSMVGKR
jgi:signal transduction histidine kinase/tetratricopeptide (TPR) repeat protein